MLDNRVGAVLLRWVSTKDTIQNNLESNFAQQFSVLVANLQVTNICKCGWLQRLLFECTIQSTNNVMFNNKYCICLLKMGARQGRRIVSRLCNLPSNQTTVLFLWKTFLPLIYKQHLNCRGDASPHRDLDVHPSKFERWMMKRSRASHHE